MTDAKPKAAPKARARNTPAEAQPPAAAPVAPATTAPSALRAPGVPATPDNTPAPAFDPVPQPDRPGHPFDAAGKSDPAQSASGLPPGAAGTNAPE